MRVCAIVIDEWLLGPLAPFSGLIHLQEAQLVCIHFHEDIALSLTSSQVGLLQIESVGFACPALTAEINIKGINENERLRQGTHVHNSPLASMKK